MSIDEFIKKSWLKKNLIAISVVKEITEVKKIFSSEVSHIQDECVTMCSKVLKRTCKDSKKSSKRVLAFQLQKKEHLDDYVIGQS